MNKDTISEKKINPLPPPTRPSANIPHNIFSHYFRKIYKSTNFSLRPERTEFSCNTAHDCNVAFLPLQHMREHLLSKGENSENIQFNHLPVSIQRGFFKQSTLRPTSIVYKNVNLEGKLHEFIHVLIQINIMCTNIYK